MKEEDKSQWYTKMYVEMHSIFRYSTREQKKNWMCATQNKHFFFLDFQWIHFHFCFNFYVVLK